MPRLERAVTNPSQLVRERYTTALNSKKQTSTNYRPEQIGPRRELREHDIQIVERALIKKLSNTSLPHSFSNKPRSPCVAAETPRIKVKTSAQSITIIIPEGIKLPVVATIQSAGSFETQMSTTNIKEASEASSTVGVERNQGRSSRRASLSGYTSDTATRESDHTEMISGFGFPFLDKVVKGRLNVSEASVPAPQSTEISAEGQVYIPGNRKASDQARDALYVHRWQENEVGALQVPAEHLNPSHETTFSVDNPSATDPAGPGQTIVNDSSPADTDDPASNTLSQSGSAVEPVAKSLPKIELPKPTTIPEIRIHRPSGTVVMTSALGTSAMNNSGPPTPSQSAANRFPTSTETTPLNDVPTLPTPEQLANPTSITSTGPLDAARSALQVPVPGLPLGADGSRRRKVVSKARQLIVRKRVLHLILGRELADLVHPQLNQVGNVAGAAPLPVDGAGDLISAYSRRNERKRDARKKHLDRKITSAKLHAEAEELFRCPRCQGLTKARHLRKYHRLQLMRERPDMKIFDRHIVSMERVAALRCRCGKRLFGGRVALGGQDQAGVTGDGDGARGGLSGLMGR